MIPYSWIRGRDPYMILLARQLILQSCFIQLFTDLVFADFLVTFTPFVGKVIFQ